MAWASLGVGTTALAALARERAEHPFGESDPSGPLIPSEKGELAMPVYTDEQLDQLRRMIGDETVPYLYDDTTLSLYLDQYAGEMIPAAAFIWREKAAVYADSVDITEAGSSRKESDKFDAALAMAKWYEGQLAPAVDTDTVTPSTTRRIVRR